MSRVIVLLSALMFAAPAFAQCSAFALHGDWSVFYPDNTAPDSVLSPDSVMEIRYFSDHDQFTVQLDDPYWKARRNTWSAECFGDITVLTGVLQEHTGTDRVMVEIHRVTSERDLVARGNGVRRLDQLSIRVLECLGPECDFVQTRNGDRTSLPAADPGHAHADR